MYPPFWFSYPGLSGLGSLVASKVRNSVGWIKARCTSIKTRISGMFPKKKGRGGKRPKGVIAGTLSGVAFVWRKIGSLVIMGAIGVGIWYGTRHTLSSFEDNPWITWSVGIAALLLLCFLVYQVVKRIRKNATATTDDANESLLKRLREKFADFRSEYVKDWMFYPLYVFIPWFILVGWVFQHWFPNAFSWLWNDDRILFWTIPSILTVLVWIWVYKRFLPRAFCVVILGFLIWASISSFADYYTKTPAWIAYKARKAAERVEEEIKKQDALDAKSNKILVETSATEWSRIVTIPMGYHYDIWPSEDCVVSFRKDSDETQVLHYDFTKRGPERKPLDLNFGPGERTLEFKADKPVTITVKLTSNF